MNTSLESSPLPPPIRPALGLAIASLILGLLAVFGSLILVGALFGVVGVVLGFIHVRSKRGPNSMAWWGVGLSVLGIVASIGFGVFYVFAVKQFQAAMAKAGSGTPLADWQGVAAPDFTVTTLDGQTITLRGLKGKRVVLDFWATWCPPCRKEIPHFIQLVNDLPKDELVVVGISSETEEKLKKFVQEHGINYPIASAQGLPAPFADVRSIPTTFFIDRHGVIQNVLVGYHDLTALKGQVLEKDFEGQPKPPPAPKAKEEPPPAPKANNQQ